MLSVPKQTWCGLRNTGTGVLQTTWVSAPGGIEALFRELSRAPALDAQTLQSMTERFGIEFQPAGEAPAVAQAAPHHRRSRRGRGRGRARQSAPNASMPAATAAAVPVPAPVATPKSQEPARGAPRAEPVTPPPASVGRNPERAHGQRPWRESKGQPVRKPQAPARSGGHRRQRQRPGRVKEVYMGGRWVQVVGEGPMIASGREPRERQGPTSKDDETGAGPFSVPL